MRMMWILVSADLGTGEKLLFPRVNPSWACCFNQKGVVVVGEIAIWANAFVRNSYGSGILCTRE